MKNRNFCLLIIITLFFLRTDIIAQTQDSLFCIEGSKRINALKIEGVAITAVQYISSGNFIPNGGTITLNSLPVFCRVAATLKPTPSSNIRIEVWLPCANWNGRFLGTGNGG